MIIKGGSRGGPKQLARHLLRTDTNERVEVLELHSPLNDLGEAFRDWQFLSTGTRGFKGLYHVNIDPAAQYEMTPAQWKRAVDVLEETLGFTGQPRAVVMHEKNGRQHIHVVWQRTDIDTMTLRSDSKNYRAHEVASLALEQEFGHEMVPGKHAKRDREKQPEPPRQAFNHASWQQAERTGVDPRDRKDVITALYRQSDNGHALKVALEEEGYILAQGDRGYVIVDTAGAIHALARQTGMRKKELEAFMSDVTLASLPLAEEAQALQRKGPEPPRPEPERKKLKSKFVPELDAIAPTHPEPQMPQPEDPQQDETRAALEKATVARTARTGA
ncbi:MAG: relaxase/mobilization nuclease domain-containing protein [Gammaproteobacteria bacterium]